MEKRDVGNKSVSEEWGWAGWIFRDSKKRLLAAVSMVLLPVAAGSRLHVHYGD
jgi:hypothetical protein